MRRPSSFAFAVLAAIAAGLGALPVSGTISAQETAPAKKSASAPEAAAPGTATPAAVGPGGKVRKQTKPGEVTIEDQVRAAFRVEPVVHRLDGRKGQLIPFEFTITSQGDGTDVDIRPVALKQEENGVIMPDTDAPSPKALTFEGPASLSLKAEEPYVLKGTVRVPSTQSSFHSFGLLVTDKGRKTGEAPAGQPNQPQFGVDFVTRYLLRCDINVEGVRPADAHKLVIEGGTMLEVDGRPQAKLFVSNPTESPLEFEMKTRLVSVTGGIVGKEFNLVSPVRSSLAPPERYLARVLPGARVRLEEFIPFAVFSGDYQFEASLMVHGRRFLTAQFPVSASEKDYPAQAAAVAQIANGISASPAQVELSLQRGGERFVSVVIANQSTESYTVNASPLNRDRTPADWFIVRPQAFGLPSGATRKVLISMPATRDPDAPHQYGLLNFGLADEAGEARGSGTIDVGLLARTETNPELNVGNLAWDGAASPPAVVLPLKNKGAVHFPLNARMTLSDAEGHRVRFVAGYGRWLLPGDSTELRFRMKDAIPAGRYTLRIQIDTKEGLAPVEITTPVELTQ
ncbi:MAG: hypothetical protein H7062_14035 [Candidatus Saccharimonas sp.]|nr:hypothetical protein [Planctomycetaceae bacterium]